MEEIEFGKIFKFEVGPIKVKKNYIDQQLKDLKSG